jgi:phosphate-selective porin OprO/OprP
VRIALLTLFTVAILSPRSVAAEEDWKAYWKNGTRIESSDGDYKIKLGGRVQTDFSFVDADSALADRFDFESGSEFRRARLFVEGTIKERFEFKAQYEFATGEVQVKDVYLGLTKIPVLGGIRVGHFKEPFGLEQLTSAKYLPFLERAYVGEPERNMGIMAHNAIKDERLTWALGTFQDTDDSGTSRGDGWNTTARITGLPMYQDDGRRLFHVGLAGSHRSPVDDTYRIRERPGSHISPRLIDSGSVATTGVDLLGLELAYVHGPFWAQAEGTQISVDEPTSGDLSTSYVQAGYFLTGENKAYKKSAAVFDRLKPKSDFLEGGIGAWEIALRYATSDYTDGDLIGGEQDGITVGLNWYPHSAARVMLNYISTELKDVGTVDFVTLRFQVDF